MNNITFRYNGRNYNPKNPEKKLKQLGITWDDVEIIPLIKKEEPIEYADTKLYYFIDPNTNYSITSINPDTPIGYKPTTLEQLKIIWNQKKQSYTE